MTCFPTPFRRWSWPGTWNVPQECLQCARNHGRTLLRTTERTADFTSHTMEYLSKQLAPCITRHGVLLDIYGEGVMITGDSGVGKSESAIELIMRGHRLVADDAVEIRALWPTS